MKKQEMIQKLTEFFYKHGFNIANSNYENHIVSDRESEQVIDFLVKEGMLAPNAQLSKIKARDNAWED